MKKESLFTTMPKLITTVILIVGIGAVLGVLGYFWAMPKSDYSAFETAKEPMIKKEIKCPDNWKEYGHDVIGISFCYPDEWGEPNTSFIKNLTRLPNMEEEFKTQNIYYENKLDIVFEKNRQINIRLFNDQYSGKSQRGINEPYIYYESGVTGDVINLKINGDICDYKIGYDYKYNAQMEANPFKTIYSDCFDGIKTVLTQNRQTFNFGDYRIFYTYDLRLLSFKKLKNNYFDNALTSRKVDQANQIHEELATLDEFFNKEKTTNVEEGIPTKNIKQLEQEFKEFQQFIDSIIIYNPLPKVQAEFEKNSNEDADVTVIRKYYWLLTNGKLNEAYEMRSDQIELSYETFQDWYKDIYHAEPYDFKKINSNEYEFYVEYQDHNKPKTKFKVGMSANGNEIKTLFSDEILTEEISFGEYSAYAIKRGNKNYMILAENGKEIIIDEGDASYDFEHSNLGTVKFFHKPKFSPKGNYLIYSMSGWEWGVNYVYDIKNKTVKISGSGHGFDFTPDEKYFYTCSSMGMITGAGGEVYSVPDFDIEFDALDNVEDYDYNCFEVDCRYDENSKNIIFTLSDEKGDVKETKSFSVIEAVN